MTFRFLLSKYLLEGTVLSSDQIVDDLIERYGGSKRERIIMYHGTAGRLVSKIVSSGLDPFPGKRAWADDPYAGFNRPSRASIGGTYLTTNLMTAKGAAGRVSGHGKALGIVVVEVQPRSLVADEDDVTVAADLVGDGHLVTEYSVASWWMYLKAPKSQEEKSFIEKARSNYVDAAIRLLKVTKLKVMHPRLEDAVRKLLRDEGFEAALTRKAAYSYPYSDTFSYELKERGVEAPDRTEAERLYAGFADRLTRTLKSIARPLSVSDKSGIGIEGRTLQKITTRSKGNRIVAAVVVHLLSSDPYYEIDLVYGRLPKDFIKQWTERIGSGYFDSPGSPVARAGE